MCGKAPVRPSRYSAQRQDLQRPTRCAALRASSRGRARHQPAPSGSAPRPNSRRSSKPSQSLARTRGHRPRARRPFASPSTTGHSGELRRSSHARSTKLRRVRLRDGALRWGIYRDAILTRDTAQRDYHGELLDYLRSRKKRHNRRRRAHRSRLCAHRGTRGRASATSSYAREIANPHTA